MAWDFIDQRGYYHNIEAETSAKADEYAQGWYASYIENNESPKNGQTFSAMGELVELDDDDVEIERIECRLEYNGYHGDIKEHGTW